jgi:hypothetical protein
MHQCCVYFRNGVAERLEEGSQPPIRNHVLSPEDNINVVVRWVSSSPWQLSTLLATDKSGPAFRLWGNTYTKYAVPTISCSLSLSWPTDSWNNVVVRGVEWQTSLLCPHIYLRTWQRLWSRPACAGWYDNITGRACVMGLHIAISRLAEGIRIVIILVCGGVAVGRWH